MCLLGCQHMLKTSQCYFLSLSLFSTTPPLIIAAVFGILSFFLLIPITPPPPQELKPISIVVLPWVMVSEAGILPLWSQG